MPSGLFVVFTSCREPWRHEEFNRWYSHTHLPDLSRATGFVGARRFVNILPGRGPTQYLALYSFESPDLLASVNDLRRLAGVAVAAGRHIDFLDVGWLSVYREIDPGEYEPVSGAPSAAGPRDFNWGTPSRKPPAPTLPRAALLAFTDCTDPKREEEFNRWYSHVHVPDTAEAAGVVKGTRYRNEQPGQAPSDYLALYEIEGADTRAITDTLDRMGRTGNAHARIDCYRHMGAYLFQEIDASAYQPLPVLDYPRENRSRRFA